MGLQAVLLGRGPPLASLLVSSSDSTSPAPEPLPSSSSSSRPALCGIHGRYRATRTTPAGAIDPSVPGDELVWTRGTVYWLRSDVVYRQFSFDTEPVGCAVFGRFKRSDSGFSGQTTGVYVPPASKTENKTFGPFHTSFQAQYASTRGSLKGKEREHSDEEQDCLVVFLQTEAHVYLPTGESIITPLPFAVDRAWPLETGGLLLQRALEIDDKGVAGRTRHTDIVGSLQLDIFTADSEEDEGAPRIYTIAQPFDEPKAVLWRAVHGGPTGDVPPTSELLLVHGTPYHLVVFYNTPTSEIVFCRMSKVPTSPPTVSAPPSRQLPAEELLRDIRPAPTMPQGGRPSLHRTHSAFDKRQSLGIDPLERHARRAPRTSKAVDAASDLQAALDPSVAILSSAPSSRMAGRSHIVPPAAVRAANPELRRQSGATFLREDNDVRPRRSLGRDHTLRDAMLQGIAERDMRETTMLMGLEHEERPTSEVVLEKMMTWTLPDRVRPEDLTVFITDNLDSSAATVNVFCATAKRLYRFSCRAPASAGRLVISPEAQCECLSAVPIVSTRPAVYDTLILDTAGALQILAGSGKLISLAIPHLPRDHHDVAHKLAESLSMAIDSDESMDDSSEQERAVRILGATGSTFSLRTSGRADYRLSAGFVVQDRLARQIIEALSYVMPDEAFCRLHSSFLQQSQDSPDTSSLELLFRLLRRMCGPALHRSYDALQTTALDPVLRRLMAVKAQGRAEHRDVSPKASAEHVLDPDDTARVLLGVHLVAQDCRLTMSREAELLQLAPFLIEIAIHLGYHDWADYWIRLVPGASQGSAFDSSTERSNVALRRFETPPDVLSYLSRRLSGPVKPFPDPSTCLGGRLPSMFGSPTPCFTTKLIIDLYNTMGVGPLTDSADRSPLKSRAHQTVLALVRQGLDQAWLANLSPGVAMPILEMLRFSQGIPAPSWPREAYRLIGRLDLAARFASTANQVQDKAGDARLELQPPPDIGDIGTTTKTEAHNKRADDPSLPFVRFGQDRRVQEVERIMQISRVRTIVVEDPKGMSEADLHQHRQNMVNLYAHRTLSTPIGKGVFEYGTRSAVPHNRFEIPILELAVKIPPHPSSFNALIAPDMADWPCFHNGTAAALALSPTAEGVDSTWIAFNRSATSTPEHAGFLLGLGLNGHLRKLSNVHIFENLNARHDYNSVGVLLGLACSHAGSQDQLITKTLSLHTRSLLPLGSVELNASSLIQSSALVGLGLLYVGTKNLRMAEIALAEIGRSDMPGVDSFNDYQEAYSFSAAMAFGLIMLGRGDQSFSQIEHRMVARLRACISAEAGGLGSVKPATVDTTITSSGAALALGLMYLKSGRKDMADILEIPVSAFAAEHVRPDLLLVRTFARCLIMWDEITPTPEWIQSLVPSFIRAAVPDPKKTSSLDLDNELIWFNVVAGACLAIGIKYAGTATEMAHTSLLLFFGILNKAAIGQSTTYEGRIRRTAARQALNVVMLAHAAVMSGTGELGILRRLRLMHGQEGAGIHYGTHMATTMACGILFMGRGHYTLGNSNLAVAAMSIAFFPRFLPGAGDNRAYPQAFRHLWALAAEPRCLIAKDVDTRETIYLPVKITLQEGEQRRQQLLISPTLVAPFDNIVSIEVDSPRYWPIKLDLKSKKDRDVLTRTRTIYAKRKAVYMDYNSDPKGHRSINVRVGLLWGLDVAYDLLSPAAPPTISAADLADLLQAHSGDPAIIQLAASYAGDTHSDLFVRNVILECVGQDKLDCLGVYLTLWQRLHGPRELLLLRLAQIRMIQHFYRPTVSEGTYLAVAPNGDKRQPMLRTGFVSALSRRMTEAEPTVDSVSQYFRTRSWTAEKTSLALYLERNHVPPVSLLKALGDRLGGQNTTEEDRNVCIARVRRAALAYWLACEREHDLRPPGQLQDTGAGQWSEDSLKAAVDVWLA